MAEYVNGKNIETPKTKFGYKQPDYDPELGFMGLKKLFAGLNKPGQEGFDPNKGLFGFTLRPEQIERRAGWRKNREERRKRREARRSGVPLEEEDITEEELDDEGWSKYWDWDYWFPEGEGKGEGGTVDIDTSVGNADLGLLTNELRDAGVEIGDYTDTFLYDDIGDDDDYWDFKDKPHSLY